MTRDAPHLLGVGLEEVLVQPPPEARRVEALEVVLVLGRAHAHPEVRRRRSAPPRSGRGCAARSSERAGSRRACRGRRCGSGAAGRAWSRARGSRPRARRPRVTFVKNRWPPMSKRQPSRCDGLADAADDVGRTRGSSRRRACPAFIELVRRGEPGRPGADDHDAPTDPARCSRRSRQPVRRSAISLGNPVGRRPGGVLIAPTFPAAGSVPRPSSAVQGTSSPENASTEQATSTAPSATSTTRSRVPPPVSRPPASTNGTVDRL